MAQAHDAARPANPAPLPEADAYAVCREFTLLYALPAMEPGGVIQGPLGAASPPPSGSDFAVISVVAGTQRGTTVETFTADDPDASVPGVLEVRGLIELSVRVDFYSDADLARQRAQRLAVVARSSVGAAFFRDRGMSALYAEDVRDAAETDGTTSLLRRCSVVLHLACWSGDSVEMDYFNTATLARLEDVDAHHKP